MNWQQTPVYITNFNNLERGFRQLLDWLINAGMANITIIDNASTYEPLLVYYADLDWPLRICRLTENKGPYALWELGLVPA